MPKLPRVTAVQMLRALRRREWMVSSTAGSHTQLVHSARLGKVTVPMHRGDLKPGTIAGILKPAGLTADELRELL